MKKHSKVMSCIMCGILLGCYVFYVPVMASALVVAGGEKIEENNMGDVEVLLSPDELLENGFHGRSVISPRNNANSLGVSPMAIPGVNEFYSVLPIDVETQINGYYCGPATVIQNMEWISSGSFNMTQRQVASAIGTTSDGSSSTRMTSFMNSQINSNGYAQYNYAPIDINASSFTEDFYVDTVYSNCFWYNWPSYGSFRLNASTGSGNSNLIRWPYSTSGGHFLSYSGVEIMPTYNNIRFTDSNYLNVYPNDSESDARYWVSASICMDTMRSFIW